MTFLALLCLEQALPLGGRITIAETDARWQITARSVRLRVEPGHWAHLSPQPGVEPAPVGPAQVQFALLASESANRHRPLSVEQQPDEITIAF